MTDDFWAQGDYHGVIGQHLTPTAEAVVEAARGAPGMRILDVGCGTGNAALAAAKRGADATGLDLSRGMLHHARIRAGTHRLGWIHGDAQTLPFPDARFDSVVSVFAHVFAPDPERATREMLRVARPGARVVYTAWRHDSASGAMNAAIHRLRPDIPLAALEAGTRWADPEHVRARLDGSVAGMDATDGEVAFPAADAADFVRAHARASPGMIGVLKPFAGRKRDEAQATLADALSPFHHDDAVRFRFRRNRLDVPPA